jgi:predicted signal transduction protein with EAL and GGDEF domain
MADLADRMGLSIVAEGIETPKQLAVLRDLGYPLGQGHLMARPLNLADATDCVAGEQPWMPHWTDAAPRTQRCSLSDDSAAGS